MSLTDFLKKLLLQFFIVVTGVTIATGILGLSLYPDARFGYEAYFSPVFFGVISVLPTFILFSGKELTFRQMLTRRILHFTVLELVLVGFCVAVGMLHGANAVISFAVSVFAVYLFTNLVQYFMDRKTADKINDGLKKLQE